MKGEVGVVGIAVVTGDEGGIGSDRVRGMNSVMTSGSSNGSTLSSLSCIALANSASSAMSRAGLSIVLPWLR
jgi:hypothetical protein